MLPIRKTAGLVLITDSFASHPRAPDCSLQTRCIMSEAKLSSQNGLWRAAADEDGHYSFAVPLR
jgi:hypothetical protein